MRLSLICQPRSRNLLDNFHSKRCHPEIVGKIRRLYHHLRDLGVGAFYGLDFGKCDFREKLSLSVSKFAKASRPEIPHPAFSSPPSISAVRDDRFLMSFFIFFLLLVNLFRTTRQVFFVT